MDLVEKYVKELITDSGKNTLAEICALKNYPPGFTFGPHQHNHIEMNYVKKGFCFMKFNDEVVRFDKSDVMIIYPNNQHYFYVGDKPTSLVQLEFRMDIFPELKPDSRLDKELIFLHNVLTHSQKYMKVLYNPDIIELIEKIVIEINEERDNYKIQVKLMYAELFIALSRYINETFKYTQLLPNENLNQALKIINARYNEELDVEQVASHCRISGRYLRNLFHKYLNTTPIEYIQSLRIGKAKEMMRNIDQNLKEIAYSTGFSNQPYFCKKFREITGMSPIEYRKTLLR